MHNEDFKPRWPLCGKLDIFIKEKAERQMRSIRRRTVQRRSILVFALQRERRYPTLEGTSVMSFHFERPLAIGKSFRYWFLMHNEDFKPRWPFCSKLDIFIKEKAERQMRSIRRRSRAASFRPRVCSPARMEVSDIRRYFRHVVPFWTSPWNRQIIPILAEERCFNKQISVGWFNQVTGKFHQVTGQLCPVN